MRKVVARSRIVAVAFAIAVAAAGCSFEFVTSPLVSGSQWRVAAVDDESTLDLELILTIIGDTATLSSRCGASTGMAAVDADGRAVSFGALEGPGGEPICPPEALELHARVATAFQGVERWQSLGRDIELRGERVIRLQPQATDT